MSRMPPPVRAPQRLRVARCTPVRSRRSAPGLRVRVRVRIGLRVKVGVRVRVRVGLGLGVGVRGRPRVRVGAGVRVRVSLLATQCTASSNVALRPLQGTVAVVAAVAGLLDPSKGLARLHSPSK